MKGMWKINKCKSQYLSHQLMYYESNMKSEGTGTIIYRNTWISERTGLKGIGIYMSKNTCGYWLY